MIYLQLFYAFLKIGLFGFGGGYAMLSLIQSEIVDRYGWISASEFTDIVAISQMTPGPIAINSATYVGYASTHSVWGSALATVAVCLPSVVIMYAITRFYLKLQNNPVVRGIMYGLKPMVIALIGSAAIILITPANFPDTASYVIFGFCLVASFMKVNPILLIVLSGVAGYIIY